MTTPTVRLNNGVEIPQVGFGVFKVPAEQTRRSVLAALEAGYRHVDTAALYGNEREVGEAVRESGVEDVFVTTKVWNDQQGYDAALRAFDASAERLGLDVVDLYLIHWPVPAQDLYVETWKALERLLADGRVRAIGVSNFEPAHLDRIAAECDVPPAINQVELHPYLQQREVRAADEKHGVVTEAWSPLSRGGDLLTDPVVTGIAAKHERTPAQVLLRWQLDLGHVVIPKSVTPERIRENLAVTDFALDADDHAAIEGLDHDGRIGPHPDRMGG